MFPEKSIHFIGIGGIGISALAHWCLAEGKRVTGSDTTDSALIEDLRKSGAHISVGHDEKLLSGSVELVIYTEAIDKNTNPEYLRAAELGIPTLSYFEALGKLTAERKTIAVIGTHGKTTTTAMLGLALIEAGLDPTVIVGSKVPAFDNRNIYIGGSDLMAVEACEYRRSFLHLKPFAAILLNCEAEHLDYYKDEADYLDAYREFIKKLPKNGFLVANMDDENVQELVKECSATVIPVHQDDLGRLDFKMKVLGEFNRLNAVHVYKAVLELGGSSEKAQAGIESFTGTWRRMELKGSLNGAVLIDDYGHHPTEVEATLKAIKQHYPGKRLVCIFQPHQYSRTHLFLDGFQAAFSNADKVIITDIYEARDSRDDKEKIDSSGLAEKIAENHPDAVWGGSLEAVEKLARKEISETDVVVTMGAGSVGILAENLAK